MLRFSELPVHPQFGVLRHNRSSSARSLTSTASVESFVRDRWIVGVAVPTVGGSPDPGSPVAVAAGAAVAVFTLWFGPGGGSLRRGIRTSLRAAIPRTHEVPSAAVLAALALLLGVWALQHGPAQWWPLHSITLSLPQWLSL